MCYNIRGCVVWKSRDTTPNSVIGVENNKQLCIKKVSYPERIGDL